MGTDPAQAVVPALVGLSVPAAYDAALDAGLLAVVEPDSGARGDTVTVQYPLPARRLRRGDRVRIWSGPDDDGSDGGDGGGGTVVPPPSPQTASGTTRTPQPA